MAREIAITFVRQWTNEVSVHGFTQIPNLLITCQGHLNLTDGELVTLIELLKFWYEDHSRIYPSIDTLCAYSGRKYSTVQRRLKSLEMKEFIERKHHFATSDDYYVHPAVEKLYKHQQNCTFLSRFRGDDMSDLSRLPSSYPTDKQYEAKENLSTKNTKNHDAIDFSDLSNFYDE